MQHLDPKQVPDALGASPRPRRSSVKGWVASAAVAIVGLGAGLTYFFPNDNSDHLTPAEVQQVKQAFDAHGPIKVDLVPADQVRNAVAQMQLQPHESALLLARLGNVGGEPLRLARVQLWDSAAEDGDVVAISSAGFQRAIPLLHQPTEITVPVDASNTVQVTGVHDGGGGITLGIRSGTDHVALPVMVPGQSLTFPVSL